MAWSDWWRGWLRGRAFRRLRRRHGSAPEGLEPGQWVAGGQGEPEGPVTGYDELGRKLRRLSAAFREARRKHPPRRCRR